MIPFQVESTFTPAGDQPKAIDNLANVLQDVNKQAVLLGVTGSGKTFTMAHIIQKLQRPTLVIAHNKTLAAQLYREFKNFFPHNAVEYFISYYDFYQPEAYLPTSDTYIEKETIVNDEIDMLRLSATSSLLERRDVIVVASVSCVYGLGSPESYEKATLILNKNQRITREEILSRLVYMQYNRNDAVHERGSFQVKGEIIEIVPAYLSDGIRIEMFGDEIENIGRFDLITRELKLRLEKAIIYPAKHFITESVFLDRALENIQKELDDRVTYFIKNGKAVEEQRIQQRTTFDLEMLREMKYCNGIENYSRHLTNRSSNSRPACLLDYFTENALIILDESHVMVPQLAGMYAGDRSRKETLVEHGFRLPSALDNRPLRLDEFEEIATNVLYVSATPAPYEMNKADTCVEQIIRPTGLLDPVVEVRPSKNQIMNIVQEVNKRVTQKERILITTLTKKMAEDLTDYLAEMNIRVRYMHSEIDALERTVILQELRKGNFDVLVGINLLREGLDIPEVSLVLILDADKEGFLRSSRSLIQTIGRAARNVNGTVIMYADTITRSMQVAIDETERRRQLQMEYNKENNINPRTIKKEVVDIIDRVKAPIDSMNKNLEKKFINRNFASEEERDKKLRDEMHKAAEELDFEKAIFLRDLLKLGSKDV